MRPIESVANEIWETDSRLNQLSCIWGMTWTIRIDLTLTPSGSLPCASVSYTFVSVVLVLAYAAHTGSSVRDLVLMRRADWTGLVRAGRERVTRLVQVHAPAPTPHSPA